VFAKNTGHSLDNLKKLVDGLVKLKGNKLAIMKYLREQGEYFAKHHKYF
jgi:hypothetical protein